MVISTPYNARSIGYNVDSPLNSSQIFSINNPNTPFYISNPDTNPTLVIGTPPDTTNPTPTTSDRISTIDTNITPPDTTNPTPTTSDRIIVSNSNSKSLLIPIVGGFLIIAAAFALSGRKKRK